LTITIQGIYLEYELRCRVILEGDEKLFYNLKAEMAREKITIKLLAERTGISYKSLKRKISGDTEFKKSEIVLIKREFPQYSLDYLFASKDEVGK